MKQATSFHAMIPDGWCEYPDQSKFLFRLYSIVPCSLERLGELFSEQSFMPTADGVPVWLGGCELKASNLLKLVTGTVHSNPDTGEIVIPTEADSFDLPRSAYLLLATPHQIDGTAFKEAETLARLDRVEALVSIYFGSNLVYKKVFEAVYEATPAGKYSVVGDEMAAIQSSNGPATGADKWELFQESCIRIEAFKDTEKKERINRALEFFHSAKSSPDKSKGEKFFFYWTSFQVLCEGKGTMATNSQLQSIYGFSKEEVEDLLLWKGVLNARNDFFHHGKKINLHKDAERYLQLLFLDLLHHQLGYAPVRAALNSKEHLDLRIFENAGP